MSEQIPIQQQAQPTEKISFQEFLKHYDGQHAEWLTGEVEVLVSNNELHQEIFMFLIGLLKSYLKEIKIGRLLVASFTMYISDEVPAREPDLMIVLQENLDRVHSTYVNGTADIAVEIISPESDLRDRGTKFLEYEAAGVREYWLIDPIRKTAKIFVLHEDQHYHEQPLDSQGRLNSTLLPKFAVTPDVFWQEELPAGTEIIALLREMAVIE